MNCAEELSMYRVEVSSLAGKELQRIYASDNKIYHRLVAVIESLRLNPYQGKKLKGKFQGDYSVRVGHYRVLYSVFKTKLIVYVIDVGHRREIYRLT